MKLLRKVKRQEKKRLQKALSGSISLHFLLLLLAFFFRKEVPPEEFIRFTILEDPLAVNNVKKSEIRRGLKKSNKADQKPNRQKKRGNFLLKLASLEKKAALKRKHYPVHKKDEVFLSDFEKQILSRKQQDKKNSKKIKDEWLVEESVPPRNKKSLEEEEEAQIYFSRPESIKWKRGARRTIRVKPKFIYPLQYRKSGIQGNAKFLIFVDPSGNVTKIRLIRGTGYSKLDVIAKQALRKTKFNPLVTNQTVYNEGEIEVRFQLKD